MANTIRISLQRFLLLISVFCSPLFSSAQISDHFSDGNLSLNPEWFGDINRFTINENGQLQLWGNSEAGISVLAAQNAMVIDCEWHFYIRLAFSPSSNNNARVYLQSDQANFKDTLNGYFLQFGESGSDDAIELFKQKGTEINSVCRGTNAKISGSFAMNVKVLHFTDGLWEIYCDMLDGSGYLIEASGYDTEMFTTEYFGFLCKYTSSNSEKMYFDDVYVGPILIDNTPPSVSEFSCTSDTTLTILFSEDITSESGLDASHYISSGGIGSPVKVEFIENYKKLALNFETHFENRQNHDLEIQNIYDLAGNQIKDTSLWFSYFEALPGEIVINEIMDDPEPPLGLPEFEFLELFNPSEYDMDIDGWTIAVNEKLYQFGPAIFPSKSYLIICHNAALDSLSVFGQAYSFPGFLLPNSGSEILLKNKQGTLISAFNYQKSQFQNTDKADGGWSIEQINLNHGCFGIDNWAYSTDNRGGSPGEQNAIYSDIPPIPEILNFELLDNNTIQLDFLNPMDWGLAQNLSLYEIEETGNHPNYIIINEESKSILLVFSDAFMKNETFTLKIDSSLKNCIGIPFSQDQFFTFCIPDTPEYQDLVINEILFRPLNQGEEYVEFYNRSAKILDLSTLELCLISHVFPQPPDTVCSVLSVNNKYIFPEQYVALTRSPEKVIDQYYCPEPDHVLMAENLIRLTDGGGLLGLKRKDGVFVDLAEYHENMHYPLLNYSMGVSLEKIHFDLPGLVHENWISASFASGFGTPASQNSQYSELNNAKSEILISPHVFTPNNDGHDDILQIEYQLDEPGFTANILIFNAEGAQVRQLVSNELLGTEGVFYWNGFDDHSEKMPRGIYIVFIEIFDLEGHVKRYKETAVLGEAF